MNKNKTMPIINFRDTEQVKQAVDIAAIKAGFKSTSRFLAAWVRENEFVKKELGKKKVPELVQRGKYARK